MRHKRQSRPYNPKGACGMDKREMHEMKKEIEGQVRKVLPDPEVSFTYLKRENWGKSVHAAEQCLRQQFGIPETASQSNEKALFMDMDSALMSRRTKAVMNSRDDIMPRYDYGHKDWIKCNISNGRFSDMEDRFSILFAAAIWILDTLAESGADFDDLYALLPTDRRLLDRLPSFNPTDCSFENDLIRSVVYVLYFRNEDFAPLEYNGFNGKRGLFCKPAATGKIKSDAPCRQTFEKLIALIPKQKIEQAVQQYQDCHQAWIESFFETIHPLCKETDEIAAWVAEWKKKQAVFMQELKKLNNAAKTEFEKKPAPTRENLMTLHNKIQQKSSASLDYSYTSPKQHIDDMNNLWKTHPNSKKIKEKLEESLAENDALFSRVDRAAELTKMRMSAGICFQSMLQYKLMLTKKMLPEHPEFKPPQLPVTNSYAICFALLYLIETGSDLPWLYGPSTAITEQACMQLPWAFPENVKRLCVELKALDLPAEPEKQEKIPVTNWTERKYSAKDPADKDFQKSIEQIFFEISGFLAPRELRAPSGYLRELQSHGLPDDVSAAILYAMGSITACNERRPARNFDDEYMQAIMQKKGMPERISRAELEEKSAGQEAEIRRLRAELHDAEKQSAKHEKLFSELKKKVETEQQELYELREFVFNLNAADDEKQRADAGIPDALPYTVQQNIIIVGGHDSWLKAIRPMLNGKVRYIGREQNFDTGMLRSADVIWIQMNAISHSQYYKVTDAARKFHKQIRLFRQASAWKCAMQIAEDEKAL